MEKEKLLMTPGPTMVPPRVLEVMRRQIIHHRTKEFETIYDELEEDLKFLFQTKNMVLMFASSGTGAMESAIVNLFSQGDKVLAISIGAFGDRFADIASTFGLDVQKLSVNWGEAVDVSEVKEILDADINNEIKAILVTHNETSTGVTNDIEALGKITKNTERLLLVDAISSLGGLDLQMDNWGIDLVVTGSQKALMAPPGLAYAALSDKAWEAVGKSKLPKFYWDYKKYKKGLLKEAENPPYTPAISLLMAQAEALKMIKEEGLENVYARHKKLALATQAGIKALGLELFPDEKVSSYIITAVKAPEGIDIAKVIKTMNLKYDIMITGGQKHLKGKIFRIGHCGYTDSLDLIKTFAALEYSLSEAGYKVEMGASVGAVQKALL
ncbi:pyridoxal-phosphate-dependent aminotransferase family protein [Ruminiclostridium papyrosolvens]|uniref:Tritium exchange subunit n=1 Tax=Ruminiclostridium papyrosolvens C7 TaxID=1330534 RepID=U4R3D0_9FIRM|nr:alanine--glyoxylate aminotransferase family protein [Ruminiclostridium papyrosolvens]EPR12229.1 class V aminotransferase [Ruminiclostridium papyrosolvens C7]